MPGRVEKCGPVQHIDWNAARRSGEYEILAVGLGVSHHYVPTAYKHARHGPDAQRVAFVFSIHVQRACYFYVWKGMVPLYSVAVFAFVTFALEPNEIGDRIGVVSALFLTAAPPPIARLRSPPLRLPPLRLPPLLLVRLLRPLPRPPRHAHIWRSTRVARGARAAEPLAGAGGLSIDT